MVTYKELNCSNGSIAKRMDKNYNIPKYNITGTGFATLLKEACR